MISVIQYCSINKNDSIEIIAIVAKKKSLVYITH